MTLDRKASLIALFGIIPFAFLLGFDITGVSVALTEIQKTFEAPYSQLQWVLSSYLIIYGSTSLLPGRIGDVLGLRRIFLLGITIFFLGALIAANSTDIWILIFGRCLQGLGAACLGAIGVALIAKYFDPKIKSQSITYFLAAATSGTVLGPVFGGVLQNTFGWRGIFWALAIYCCVFFIAALICLPSKMSERKQGSLHLLDSFLLSIGVIGLLIWLNEGQLWHWYSHISIAILIVSLLFLLLFVLRQWSLPSPLIDIKVLFDRNVLGSSLSIVFIYLSYTAYFLFLPLYYVHVQEVVLAYVGFYYLPMTVGSLLAFLVAPHIVKRFQARSVIIFAGTVMILTNGFGAFLIANQLSYYYFGINLFIFGLFAGISIQKVIQEYMIAIPKESAGFAGGLLSVIRFLSGAIGITVFTIIFLHLGESDFLRYLVHEGISMPTKATASLDLLFSDVLSEKAFGLEYAHGMLAQLKPHLQASFAKGIGDTLALFSSLLVLSLISFVTFYKKPKAQ